MTDSWIRDPGRAPPSVDATRRTVWLVLQDREGTPHEDPGAQDRLISVHETSASACEECLRLEKQKDNPDLTHFVVSMEVRP